MSCIRFEGQTYTCRENETVLEALIRGGSSVSFSCRRGSCHVCLLRATEGTPEESSQSSLREDLRALGYFLPCRCHPSSDLTVQPPDPSDVSVRVHLQHKVWLSKSVVKLLFEPELNVSWQAGQFANLRRADGLIRSYSLASIPEEDYFIEMHVKRLPDGEMSTWLCDELQPGEVMELLGPLGDCYYRPEHSARNILLMATGSGLSPVFGIARDALRQGHQGDIVLHHGSRDADGLYYHHQLRELSDLHPNFRYVQCLTGEERPEGVRQGRVVHHAFQDAPDLSGWLVYLCGLPDMVHEARCRALLAGAVRPDIHADPFELAYDRVPDDASTIASIEPDSALWQALEEGEGLRTILQDFYERAYQDPRLAPFFHNVTIERAVSKQYSFLSDLFSGQKSYFGLRPFNAHHWMVISDELFDYREALLEDSMRAAGLAETHIRRWAFIHEHFRRSIVKSSPRGMFIDGEEVRRNTYAVEVILVGSMCDGCSEAIDEGDQGLVHQRTGELFCMTCSKAHHTF